MIGRTYNEGIRENYREDYREAEYNRYAEQVPISKGGLSLYLDEQEKMLEEFFKIISHLENHLHPILVNYPATSTDADVSNRINNNSALLDKVITNNDKIKTLMSRIILITNSAQI